MSLSTVRQLNAHEYDPAILNACILRYAPIYTHKLRFAVTRDGPIPENEMPERVRGQMECILMHQFLSNLSHPLPLKILAEKRQHIKAVVYENTRGLTRDHCLNIPDPLPELDPLLFPVIREVALVQRSDVRSTPFALLWSLTI